MKKKNATLPCSKKYSSHNTSPHLSYEKYIRLQAGLRNKRRELLLFCQHPPTLTAGIQALPENLLLSKQELTQKKISHLKVDRGGDYTAHEPGQCVIYPHIDLRKRGLLIRTFLQTITAITIQGLKNIWNLETIYEPNRPGLYRSSDQAKIASIGLLFKGFFTSFGLALNVSNSLSTFLHIHPCGHKNLPICSVQSSGKDPRKLELFINFWENSFQNYLASEAKGK